MKRVYVAGTADTKGEELAFLAGRILAAGAAVTIVDLGTSGGGEPIALPATPFVAASEVAAYAPADVASGVGSSDRGSAVTAMTAAFAAFMAGRADVAGIVGIGGGGGTAMVTAGMRALPIGVPKIMVSTLASGDVSPYVDVSDIVMMPSVTDLAGLNRISRVVLHNAAQAIAAMALTPAPAEGSRPAIGLTMFGVTTPCVTAVAERLKAGHDCLIFHATGTGGRTMEKLAGSSMLEGVIDVTTTEICDLLFGGVLPAGPDRLDVIARTGIPYVGSVGACDMVNFWAPETVPERYRGRAFYRHNPNVTLMRTTSAECAEIGAWIARKLDACAGPVRVLLPEKGVSSLDVEGGAFFDAEADAALFAAIERGIRATARRRVERLPLHINDPAFADALASAYLDIAQ